jgi:hypothetical protein
MASGASIQAKITAVLQKLNATHRLVYFRTVNTSGGNSLLGLGESVANSDTEASPQPAVQTLSTDEIATSGGLLMQGDYRMIFSGAELEETLKTSLIVYGEEVLRIVKYTPAAIFGTVAAWDVIARSIKP